ncbi:MAG: LysM peptidoglycan-binding domain-containing protein, partial [Acidimicrobiales bacterium]
MMRSSRLRGYLDAFGVLICELALLGFFVKSGRLLGTVPLAHLASWAQTAGAERVLTALSRLLGLVVSGWLLVSTCCYAVAVITGRRGLLQGARLVTLPFARRAMDAFAAVSMAASAVGASAGAASASLLASNKAAARPAPLAGPGASAAPVPSGAGSGPAARPVLGAKVPGDADRARLGAVPGAQGHPQPSPGRLALDRSALDKPARVSATALGRHFPHPGAVRHVPPPPRPSPAELGPLGTDAQVPSVENGFAGLSPGTKVVVVQPGDCLSVLAERHLGDWRLDTAIEALNFGRLQPDGRALVDDHWIYVGWVLVMPPDAVGTLVVGSHASPAAPRGKPATPSGASLTPPSPADQVAPPLG